MCLVLLTDDVHAEFDALIADEDGRAGDKLAHLVLGLAAERTVEGVLRIAGFAHTRSCPESWAPGMVMLVPCDRGGQPRGSPQGPPAPRGARRPARVRRARAGSGLASGGNRL